MKQVQSKLKDIQNIYPGTKGCCIISNGECLMYVYVGLQWAYFPVLQINIYTNNGILNFTIRETQAESKELPELITQMQTSAVKFGMHMLFYLFK